MANATVGADATVPAGARSEGEGDTPRGFAFALSAYLLWGGLPLYMKAVAHIPAIEVVAHRVLWSVPVAGIIILVLKRTADLKAALKSPRTLALAALTAGLITINWSIYVWAISADRAIETALGYYINPLFNVLLGAIFLGERFTGRQVAALVLAVIGVAILTIKLGFLPWISLSLAMSFGLYGFFRKTLPIGPTQGFMLEVLILSPVAAAALFWFAAHGESAFSFATAGVTGIPDALMLMLSGPITAVPLILYAFGAKGLRYSTIGLMQYLAPTIIFLIAVFVFREPFDRMQLIAFGFIWAALAVYSSSFIRRQPR